MGSLTFEIHQSSAHSLMWVSLGLSLMYKSTLLERIDTASHIQAHCIHVYPASFKIDRWFHLTVLCSPSGKIKMQFVQIYVSPHDDVSSSKGEPLHAPRESHSMHQGRATPCTKGEGNLLCQLQWKIQIPTYFVGWTL